MRLRFPHSLNQDVLWCHCVMALVSCWNNNKEVRTLRTRNSCSLSKSIKRDVKKRMRVTHSHLFLLLIFITISFFSFSQFFALRLRDYANGERSFSQETVFPSRCGNETLKCRIVFLLFNCFFSVHRKLITFFLHWNIYDASTPLFFKTVRATVSLVVQQGNCQ